MDQETLPACSGYTFTEKEERRKG
uniref:Uncharacterized protein n=1 Tax=Anguilla anguilla TaxID=7936 RepID=A0A0E9S7B4_ANGAN